MPETQSRPEPSPGIEETPVPVFIRRYREDDLAGVLECFFASVHGIATRRYAPDQIEAWAPRNADEAAWRVRFSTGGTFVAVAGPRIVGFARAEPDGLVDLLYVHPRTERRGLGRALLRTACAWALEQGATRLEGNVSLMARPLFEAEGFVVARERATALRGVRFRTFHMERGPATGPGPDPTDPVGRGSDSESGGSTLP